MLPPDVGGEQGRAGCGRMPSAVGAEPQRRLRRLLLHRTFARLGDRIAAVGSAITRAADPRRPLADPAGPSARRTEGTGPWDPLNSTRTGPTGRGRGRCPLVCEAASGTARDA